MSGRLCAVVLALGAACSSPERVDCGDQGRYVGDACVYEGRPDAVCPTEVPVRRTFGTTIVCSAEDAAYSSEVCTEVPLACSDAATDASEHGGGCDAPADPENDRPSSDDHADPTVPALSSTLTFEGNLATATDADWLPFEIEGSNGRIHAALTTPDDGSFRFLVAVPNDFEDCLGAAISCGFLLDAGTPGPGASRPTRVDLAEQSFLTCGLVGDDPELDLTLPVSSGCTTAWIVVDTVAPDAGPQPAWDGHCEGYDVSIELR